MCGEAMESWCSSVFDTNVEVEIVKSECTLRGSSKYWKNTTGKEYILGSKGSIRSQCAKNVWKSLVCPRISCEEQLWSGSRRWEQEKATIIWGGSIAPELEFTEQTSSRKFSFVQYRDLTGHWTSWNPLWSTLVCDGVQVTRCIALLRVWENQEPEKER